MRRALWVMVVVGAMCVFGWAQEPPPVITVDPAALDFGDQPAKEASKPLRITITNGGSAKLYLNSVALGGENRGDFALGRDTCTGATIEPGKSCVVDVVMTPAVTGRRAAELTITGNSGASVQTVRLTGNGINSAAVPPR